MDWVMLGSAVASIFVGVELYVRVWRRPDGVMRCRNCGRYFRRLGLCSNCTGRLN